MDEPCPSSANRPCNGAIEDVCASSEKHSEKRKLLEPHFLLGGERPYGLNKVVTKKVLKNE